MLKRLYISNYALIEELDVSFPGQLSVITGETGAGKSIFLEALGLALGNRADAGSLQNKAKKCVIELEFDVKNYDLRDFFVKNGLDFENPVILRREINAEGKSRSFINDSPVNLTALKEIADNLIDVHSQHQTLLLNQTKFQLQLIDSFAGTANDFELYKKLFKQLQENKKHLEELENKEKQAKKDLDYYQFLFDELNEFALDEDDVKKLEDESETMENAEFIKSALSKTSGSLGGGENNLLSSVSLLKQQLQSITKFNNAYKELFERVNASHIELKDVYNELEGEEGKLVFDPEKLNNINDKLDKINRLLKKHSVNSISELLKIKDDIEGKLQMFNSLEAEIEKLKKEITKVEASCKKQAKDISDKRKKSIGGIEKSIDAILNDLSMENAKFKIDLKTKEGLSGSGIDEVSFMFSANKGGEFKELHKVASGGEMSRLMLSLKSVLAQKRALPTIIFDEIDTGISGDVANKMGNIFSQMAGKMQVISITHLPQIASKGQHHLFVYKNDDKDKTRSFIKVLAKDERTVEIAKMLSTGKPTESAIKNAKDLLSSN
ncbi:MAG: DNA repair protein RecN [Bacteroidota bacterium]|nr:DNA repair protein RecN [Bacteroidota bacterium]